MVRICQVLLELCGNCFTVLRHDVVSSLGNALQGHSWPREISQFGSYVLQVSATKRRNCNIPLTLFDMLVLAEELLQL